MWLWLIVQTVFGFPDSDYHWDFIRSHLHLGVEAHNVAGLGTHPNPNQFLNDECNNGGKSWLILVTAMYDQTIKGLPDHPWHGIGPIYSEPGWVFEWDNYAYIDEWFDPVNADLNT